MNNNFLKKLFLFLLIIWLISCFYILNGCELNPNFKKKILVFEIGTGDIGGTFYPVGLTIANIMNKYIDGVKATVKITDGSIENSYLVGSGELLFGMAMGNVAYDAVKGQGDFSEAYPNISCLFATYPSISQWITLEENKIDSINDLSNKKVAVGLLGSGSEMVSKIILDAYGINYQEEVFPQYLGAGEGAVSVRNKECVVSHTIGGVPFGAYLGLSKNRNVKLINLDEQVLNKVIKKYPYFYITEIPANSYIGQEEPVNSIGVKCLFLANSEKVSDELAYKITKTIWENIELMYSAHPSLKAMTKNFVAKDLPIPLHPGAAKYWREIGILK